MIDEVGFDSSNALCFFDQIGDPGDISADSKKYFFDKIKKKGIQDAETVYDQYLQVGFSQKAAIALTDRRFFSKPHEKNHGNYLKTVIGCELFKKEQAARKGKEDWISAQVLELDGKINSTTLKTLEAWAAKSKISSNKSQNHKYHKEGSIGGYLLGVAEIIAGGAVMVAGGALEIATCGGFTIGLGLAMGTGASLIGLGLATTTANAKDIAFPNNILPTTWNSTNVDTFDGPLNKKGTIDPSTSKNPEDLLKKPEWKETSHPEQTKNGRRTFENKETGQKLEFDKGKPGEYGHKAHDHWHRPNPNSTSKHDKYLDANGKPVGDHSDASHIYHPDNVWWKQ